MDSGWISYVPPNGVLKGQREKLGLTQEEVAERAGIKPGQYQRLEKHNVQLSTATSMRIAVAVLKALELDPTTFEEGEYCFESLSENDPRRQELRKFGL